MSRADELDRAIAAVEAALGAFSSPPADRQLARNAAIAALIEAGGAVRDGAEWSLRLAGIRATCTAGVAGLCVNWLNRARAERAGVQP